MEIQAGFGGRRGSGPMGEARMSRDYSYAILKVKMRSPSGTSWRLAAGPGMGAACEYQVGNDVG